MNPNIERVCFSGNRDTLLDSHLVTLGDNDDDVIHDQEVNDDWTHGDGKFTFRSSMMGMLFFIFRGLFNLDNLDNF